MKITDIFRIAAGNLRRNRLRTTLTVSGVVVGVGAIVFLVSLGFGLQKLALEKIVRLEALKVVTVTAGSKENVSLNKEAVGKFEKIQNVEVVSPIIRSVVGVSVGGDETEQVAYGIKPAYIDLENVKIIQGKSLSNNATDETLVSKDIVSNIGLKQENILNQNVTFSLDGLGGKEKKSLKVVGIVEEKGIFIPFDVAKATDGTYAAVRIKVKDKTFVADTKSTVEGMGFNTSVVKDQSQSVNQVFYVVNIVLGGFGMIAFFVAAIGIFNTMTISLLERTHEIGVMKAIGGNNGDIAMIFITESSLIGLLGGIFGLLAGWLAGFLLNALVNFMATQSGGEALGLFHIPLYFGLATIFFSCFISTFAGIWPAKRAARLNPLEALRYE